MTKSVRLILLLMLGAVPLVSQSKAPSISFLNGTIREFGKVTAGETLVHVFKFTNKGDATLDITKVEPG